MCAQVHTSLKAYPIHDLTPTTETGFKQLWFKVQNRKLKSLLVCVAYRPPNCSSACLDDNFMPTYTRALSFDKDIVNCNVLNKRSPEAQALSIFYSSTNLTQLITEPTRVTATSQSLIDVILVSNPRIVKNSKVVKSTISDHYIITAKLNLKLQKTKPTNITVRSYKHAVQGE